MIEKKGRALLLGDGPVITASAAVGGKKEGEGPLGASFDLIVKDPYAGEKTWEKAECLLQKKAVTLAINKAGRSPTEVELLFSGDLINQCTPSCYAAVGLGIPSVGLFGACSTAAEGLALAALLLEAGACDRAVSVTSSHFCTAERQFRTPLAYGGQRAPTAQWTVTGSGAFLLERQGSGPRVRGALLGKPVDMGISDVTNMGAAMAPAACDTLAAFFRDSGKAPDDFDLILTGDLGSVGHRIVQEQLGQEGISLDDRYQDCGLLVYDSARQDTHAGGSGCGCSAVVLAGHILREMAKGSLKNVLLAGTGALMSPMSLQQGESIVGIAHLVWISAE